MEKKKLTTAAGVPVPDNDNATTPAPPQPHAAAGLLVISTSERTNDVVIR